MACQNLGSGQIGATESCALSLKVPKPKLSGNSMKDIQMQHGMDSLIACIHILWKYPGIRSECVGYLTMAVGEKKQAVLGDEYFEQHVTTVGKLDEQWCVDYISNATHRSPAALGQAKVLDHNIVLCHGVPSCIKHNSQALIGMQKEACVHELFECKVCSSQ